MPQFFDKMGFGVRNLKLLGEKLRNLKKMAKISFYRAKMAKKMARNAHNMLIWVKFIQ